MADEFTRGVNWGKFLVTMSDDKDPHADSARLATLEAVVSYAEQHGDRGLIDAITDAWFGWHCHGRLGPNELCQDCGATNPDPDQ